VALLPDSQPATSGRLASYALTAAGDAPERDPADWVLEGLPVADITTAGPIAGGAAMQQQQQMAAGGGRQRPAGSEASTAAAAAGQATAATPAALPDNRPEGFPVAAAPAKAAAAAAQADGRASGALQGWRVLDARERVRFGSRGKRLDFQVLLLGVTGTACHPGSLQNIIALSV
jgi:hypothetical protein